MNTKTEAIQNAYEKLSDDDKVRIDLAVKALLDHYAVLNQARKAANRAIFPLSRDGALELLAALGMFLNGGNHDNAV
jgi:hypothetical protein